MEYSIKKGFLKGLVSVLSIAGSWIAFTAFSDVTIWALIQTYFEPILGSLTVGGLITMGINYLKIKLSQN
jgi:hypothetical protein